MNVVLGKERSSLLPPAFFAGRDDFVVTNDRDLHHRERRGRRAGGGRKDSDLHPQPLPFDQGPRQASQGFEEESPLSSSSLGQTLARARKPPSRLSALWPGRLLGRSRPLGRQLQGLAPWRPAAFCRAVTAAAILRKSLPEAFARAARIAWLSPMMGPALSFSRGSRPNKLRTAFRRSGDVSSHRGARRARREIHSGSSFTRLRRPWFLMAAAMVCSANSSSPISASSAVSAVSRHRISGRAY